MTPNFPEREWFEALGESVSEDREMAVIGRWFSLGLAVVSDEVVTLLRLEGGRLVEVVEGPGMERAWSVTLRGGGEDWRNFLSPVPPPFYNDLLAMNTRVPSFSIEGDRRLFIRHLRPIQRLFELARESQDA